MVRFTMSTLTILRRDGRVALIHKANDGTVHLVDPEDYIKPSKPPAPDEGTVVYDHDTGTERVYLQGQWTAIPNNDPYAFPAHVFGKQVKRDSMVPHGEVQFDGKVFIVHPRTYERLHAKSALDPSVLEAFHKALYDWKVKYGAP